MRASIPVDVEGTYAWLQEFFPEEKTYCPTNGEKGKVMRILFAVLLLLSASCQSRLDAEAERAEVARLQHRQAELQKDIHENAAQWQRLFDSAESLRTEAAQLKSEIASLRSEKAQLEEPQCHSCPLPEGHEAHNEGRKVYILTVRVKQEGSNS